jgi:hypothetical protein
MAHIMRRKAEGEVKNKGERSENDLKSFVYEHTLISLQERKSHFEIIPSFLAVKKDKRN